MPDSKKSPARKSAGILRLSRGNAKATASAVSSGNDLLAELTGLSQKIAAHAIRFQIGQIVTQARAMLNYLQTQPRGAFEWQDYVRECLLATVEATRSFAALHSHLTDPTAPAIIHLHDFLTALSHTFDNLYAKLTVEPPASSNSGINAYKSTLRDIREAYWDNSKI